MATPQFDIGIVGLGVMGANLGFNLASHGIHVAGYHPNKEKANAFTQRAKNEIPQHGLVEGFSELKTFLNELKGPRIVLMLVPAGAVDQVIDELTQQLDKDDIVIDGGNSHYIHTQQRLERLAKLGLRYLGMGISGGEAGARNGPSMMPGGDPQAWKHVAPILEPAAAIADDGKPCIAWMGEGGSGHFVKMVHNGIEYALMQLLSEVYDLLHRGGGLNHAHLHRLFVSWQDSTLASYLIDITADILTQPDDHDAGHLLLDQIRDKAGQKGTGRWTSEAAFELGVPTPVIDAAVSARNLSDYYEERQLTSRLLSGPLAISPDTLQARLAGALETAMFLSYSQGMHLIDKANKIYHFNTPISSVASIWRGGCIIRADMLNEFVKIYSQDTPPVNPIFNENYANKLSMLETDLRAVVAQGALGGIPLPAFSASLAYYDSWRSAHLPANLIQAQRDYFGSHTYERLDQGGSFHTHWHHQD